MVDEFMESLSCSVPETTIHMLLLCFPLPRLGATWLEKIHWDEDQDTVTWKSSPSGYFRGREKHFSALDFIAQLTLHIPRAAVTQFRQERKAWR